MQRENQEITITSIKRNAKLIRRTGLHAEILGWILMLLAAAALWLATTKTLAVGLFAGGLLVGLYFVITGRYVRKGLGRRVKWVLLSNSIVGFITSVAILPIYICFQSSNNYLRFKDLPDKIQDLYNKRLLFRPGWKVLAMVMIVIAIGAASLVTKLHQVDASETVLARQNSAGDPAPAADTVKKSFFSIHFPASVSATDLTTQVGGHPVSYTTYESSPTNSEDLTVYAYRYPDGVFAFSTMTAPALAAAIHNNLNAVVLDRHGTVIKSSPSTYLNHPSEDATFTCQTIGGPKPGFIRVFFIGNYEYAIIGVGASQSDFNSFANSFQYKGA